MLLHSVQLYTYSYHSLSKQQWEGPPPLPQRPSHVTDYVYLIHLTL
jgi:hypothetical protein